jgi:hypothetical protein
MNLIVGSIGSSWPLTLSEISKLKFQLKAKESDKWSPRTARVGGVAEFQVDHLGNFWLNHPGVTKSDEYIEALKLRSNTSTSQKSGLNNLCINSFSLQWAVHAPSILLSLIGSS